MYVQYHVLATSPTSAFTLSWLWSLFHGVNKFQRIKHRGLFRQAPNSKVPLPSDAATHVQIQTLLKCLESMDLRCLLFTSFYTFATLMLSRTF